mmetsp:Transcript_4931/g.6983  ORF Transcript_4931/g.6983 Transcript_4931/m.6983 type:complete len:209 (+) Transcript_4931:5-631(+)
MRRSSPCVSLLQPASSNHCYSSPHRGLQLPRGAISNHSSFRSSTRDRSPEVLRNPKLLLAEGALRRHRSSNMRRSVGADRLGVSTPRTRRATRALAQTKCIADGLNKPAQEQAPTTKRSTTALRAAVTRGRLGQHRTKAMSGSDHLGCRRNHRSHIGMDRQGGVRSLCQATLWFASRRNINRISSRTSSRIAVDTWDRNSTIASGRAS